VNSIGAWIEVCRFKGLSYPVQFREVSKTTTIGLNWQIKKKKWAGRNRLLYSTQSRLCATSLFEHLYKQLHRLTTVRVRRYIDRRCRVEKGQKWGAFNRRRPFRPMSVSKKTYRVSRWVWIPPVGKVNWSYLLRWDHLDKIIRRCTYWQHRWQ